MGVGRPPGAFARASAVLLRVLSKGGWGSSFTSCGGLLLGGFGRRPQDFGVRLRLREAHHAHGTANVQFLHGIGNMCAPCVATVGKNRVLGRHSAGVRVSSVTVGQVEKHKSANFGLGPTFL